MYKAMDLIQSEEALEVIVQLGKDLTYGNTSAIPVFDGSAPIFGEPR